MDLSKEAYLIAVVRNEAQTLDTAAFQNGEGIRMRNQTYEEWVKLQAEKHELKENLRRRLFKDK